jgi:hypothetical protein
MQISTFIPKFTVPLKDTENFYVGFWIMHTLHVFKVNQSLRKPETD